MHDSEQSLLAMPAEDTPTLDNFVVGTNGQAVMVLREVAPGAGPKIVYLYGPKGAGLTHLLTALRPPSRFRVEPFDPAVKLYTVDDIDELDLGFSRQLRNLQNEVMRVPDARLVCAGRCPIDALPLGDDIKSRLHAGVSFGIAPLNEADRTAELMRLAHQRGFTLTYEMTNWIERTLPRDMRTLSRVLAAVDRLSLMTQRPVTFPLLREVGRTSVPVLLKRGMSQTIDELLMSAEYVMSEGNPNVMLCERGIRTFETRTRNTFDVNAVPVLHHLTHLPVVADPSHSTGYTRYVRPAAYAAVAAGSDALEIEVHDCPTEAWSDGAQALTPPQFADAMRRIALIRDAVTAPVEEG